MAIISLLTDFGLEDAYVGIVKGVILSVAPTATIVDISHNVAPQDVVRAAYLLETAFRYFPPGSVHVVVVDPGVGGDRDIVAVAGDGHRFLAPDNGVLTAVLAEVFGAQAVRVENRRLFRSPVSRTFHGRDIFAPVAAHLAEGMDIEALGPAVSPDRLVRIPLSKPILTEHPAGVTGSVIVVDRFGNLVTDIGERELAWLRGQTGTGNVAVRICGRMLRGLSGSYVSVSSGEPLALMGSAGRLEISVNAGSAAEFFKAGPGEAVHVTATPAGP